MSLGGVTSDAVKDKAEQLTFNCQLTKTSLVSEKMGYGSHRVPGRKASYVHSVDCLHSSRLQLIHKLLPDDVCSNNCSSHRLV